MAKKTKAINETVYRLKVTLEGIAPPIWRELLIPADMPLSDFHYVLQDALGWTNSHLHQFVVNGQWTYSQVMGGACYGNPQFDELGDMKDEHRFTLAKVMRKAGDEIAYEYDFGDSWTHRIVLEKVLPVAPDGSMVPSCTDGARACPPDDCGGVDGYENLLKILANPSHLEYKDMKDWVEEVLGHEVNSEAFDLKLANHAIKTNKTRRLTAQAMEE